jgi:hypothetical protein
VSNIADLHPPVARLDAAQPSSSSLSQAKAVKEKEGTEGI